jgi:integral membrane protein
VTWALLLLGMVGKYVTETTELGVSVFGMLHGVVFVAYVVVVAAVAVDQRWTLPRTALGLVAAVPPFLTLWFERHAERRAALADGWRLREEAPEGAPERVLAWVVRHPALGAGAGVVAVATLTGAALLAGPPTG